MAFFLALDAGGTKTDVVLADETRELARVRTGTIKRLRTDAATATANLEAALHELTAQTGISMQSITRSCVGTAGETVPLVKDWLRESITARVSGELILLGDVEIALDAAFFGRPGVLAMAGTGSNVAGRMPDGTLTSAGGWGPALSDQGSGHRIGTEALRAMFLAKDEGRETLLLDAVLNFWQLESLDLLVEYANRAACAGLFALDRAGAAVRGGRRCGGCRSAATRGRRAWLPGAAGGAENANGVDFVGSVSAGSTARPLPSLGRLSNACLRCARR